MKYLWEIEIMGMYGIDKHFAVTDNDDPTQAIEIAKKYFTRRIDGTERKIVSVKFDKKVYVK